MALDVHSNIRLMFKVSTVAFTILSLLLVVDVFAGPLRYYLSSIGLEAVIYVPKIACLLFVVSEIIRDHLNKKLLIALLIILLFAIIGFFYCTTIASILFSLLLISPMLFGITTAKYFRINESAFLLLFVFVFTASVFGIYLDIFVDFPWKGFNYTIGGAEVEGSREWETFGVDRLAGFARSSVNAAFYIVCTGLFLYKYLKYRMLKFLVWLLAFIAILLTTNKAGLGAFLVATVSYFLAGYYQVRRLYVYALILLLIVLPFSVLIVTYDIDLTDPISLMLLASFDDRLINTWPNFISAVSEYGNFWWGVGFGGSGSASKYFTVFESGELAVADNLTLYLYGWFGFLSVFILAYFACVTLDLFKSTYRFNNSFASIMVSLLAASLTTDIIESQVFAVVLGISIGLVKYQHKLEFK